MQLKTVDIHIYRLDDDGTFEPLGVINEYTSLIWPDKHNGYTTFELTAPVTRENRDLIKKERIIWCGGDNAARIEIIGVDTDDNGQKVYKVKGRTLEMLLTTRIVLGTYNQANTCASTIMYDIVDKNCVNPVDKSRVITFLECAEDEYLGKQISFQKTGSEVYDALESISNDAELGFDILFRPKEKKLIFKVTQGVDRSNIHTQGAVVFSTDLQDVLKSSYYTNDQDVKTVAYVAGEGDGANRSSVVSGDATTKGFARREMYVDARDLQSEIQDEDGNTTTISTTDYQNMLTNRGVEKLAECVAVETFEAEMRVVGDVQYVYGVDYNKGDKILIQDTDIGVQVVATISEVSENYDDEYELDITFGYSYPTLIQKVKRQISK